MHNFLLKKELATAMLACEGQRRGEGTGEQKIGL